MAKGSTNKVSKAASAGRGRRAAGEQRSVLFPALMATVVVLGLVLIVVSRSDKQKAAGEPPALGDHWHAAYGIYVCDQFLPPLSDRPDLTLHNLHTHADGLIHIHPVSSAATGARATLGYFINATGGKITSDSLELSDGTTYADGDDCNGKPATLKIASWAATEFDSVGRPAAWASEPTVFTGDPADFRPHDDDLVTIAFVPDGTEIPQPPSVSALAAPTDENPPAGVTPPPDTSGATTETTDASGSGGSDTTEATTESTDTTPTTSS